MINNEVQKFLRNFHGEEGTYFRCIKGRSIEDFFGNYDNDIQGKLKKLNLSHYEIYFVPNSGGYKDAEISRFNCVFIDLDCGKDKEGNYHNHEIVKEYKNAKLDMINNFEYEPSYIVETRNGLHVYWLLEAGVSHEQFNECEKRLINYFDSDKVVKNAARLMRVPNFYWNKDYTDRFMVKIIGNSQSSYHINTLINHLPETTQSEKSVHNRKKYKKLLSIDDRKSSYANGENIQFLRNRDIESLQSKLNPKGIILNNHDDVYDYLKKQDMQELLGLHGNTNNCLFHNDNNPSAGFVINEETDHNIYNCMSSNCGVKLTIIQVIERLTKLNRVDSLRFLRRLYKVEYQETDWQREQKEILLENQRLILSSELSQVYPDIDKMIRNSVLELSMMNQLAIQHLQTEYFTDNQGYPIFFSSMRHIASLCGKDSRRLGDNISLFAYLGLIRKIPESEIPEFLLVKAKSEAAKKKQQHVVSFYSIPPYGEEAFQFTLTKIREYKELGFTRSGWGRELILRTLGKTEADRVYPQMKSKKISEKSNELTSQIEGTILMLIDHKGFATEHEVIEILVGQQGNKSLYEKQLKRSLPDMLNKYGIDRVRLNKELKKSLNIEDMKGYPTILYRN